MIGLCCTGCCRAGTAMLPAPALAAPKPSTPAMAQVLNLDNESEIDYTSGGTKVSQHMESAMNEVGISSSATPRFPIHFAPPSPPKHSSYHENNGDA